MRKISEVLRLQAQGLSRWQISQSVGVGKTTVGEYLRRAEAAGLGWPLPDQLDEDSLEAKLFPTPTTAAGRPVPDWREVHRELKRRRHVTLELLWMLCRSRHNIHYADPAF
ncbi:MAG: IS21 family transposase, partial [Candidatus Dormibacteria bacterium]